MVAEAEVGEPCHVSRDMSGPMEINSLIKFTEEQIISWVSQKSRVDALREGGHFLQMGASQGKAGAARMMQVQWEQSRHQVGSAGVVGQGSTSRTSSCGLTALTRPGSPHSVLRRRWL